MLPEHIKVARVLLALWWCCGLPQEGQQLPLMVQACRALRLLLGLCSAEDKTFCLVESSLCNFSLMHRLLSPSQLTAWRCGSAVLVTCPIEGTAAGCWFPEVCWQWEKIDTWEGMSAETAAAFLGCSYTVPAELSCDKGWSYPVTDFHVIWWPFWWIMRIMAGGQSNFRCFCDNSSELGHHLSGLWASNRSSGKPRKGIEGDFLPLMYKLIYYTSWFF